MRTLLLGLTLILFFVSNRAPAQIFDCDTTYAVERWSEPVRLPFWVNWWDDANMYPAWGPDGKTLYYLGHLGRICVTTLSDTGWTQVKVFPATKDFSYLRGSCMAPDNKTFYFCGSVGGAWAVFTTKWSDDSAKWLPPEPMLMWTDTSRWINWQTPKYALIPVMAESIHLSADGNQFFFDGGGKTSCSGQMEFLTGTIFVSTWDEEHQRWGERCDLGANVTFRIYCPEPDPRGTRPMSFESISPSMTANGRKLYFSKRFSPFHNFELFVAVRDSMGGWHRARRVNINSYADSTSSSGWAGTSGYDEQPAISPDGKILVFASRRNTMLYNWWEDLYISHLIVDENGDSVLTNVESVAKTHPATLSIEAFPNPTFESVAITVRKPENSFIRIELFNIYGDHVRTINPGQAPGTSMHLTWDGVSDFGVKVPSGVYILRAYSSTSVVTRRIVLLKN